MHLKKTVEKMRRYFDSLERAREKVLEQSREVVRASSRCISALHRGDMRAARRFLETAGKILKRAEAQAKSVPELLYSGIVESAQQEYCEAKLMYGFLSDGRIMGVERIGVPYRPYLGGLADVAGELRRRALDLMREGRIKDAEKVLKTMEEISENLMEFDYPDAVLPGMRRRQDAVRGIIEKTRGELTIAIRQHALEKELRRAKGG